MSVEIRKKGEPAVEESKVSKKEKLGALFAAYKQQNPIKAAAKKAEFERKLAELEK